MLFRPQSQDELKKADVDEIVSLKALDITPSKDLSDAEDLAKPKEECLVNGEAVLSKNVNGVDDDVNEVVMNGSAGIEEVDAKRESVMVKPKSNKKVEEETDAKIENDPSTKNGSLPEAKEVETIGDAVVKRKKNGVNQKSLSKESPIRQEATGSSSNREEAIDSSSKKIESESSESSESSSSSENVVEMQVFV